MKLHVEGLFAVEGKDIKEVKTLATLALEYLEKYKNLRIGSGTTANGALNAALTQARGITFPNIEKWERLMKERGTPKRLRMGKEEQDEYGEGDPAREECAKARLLAMGETLEDGGIKATATVVRVGAQTTSTIDPDEIPED